MSRKFIAGVLALSCSITLWSAAPARADSGEDIARIVGTVATIYIIGRLIEEATDGDRRVTVHTGNRGYVNAHGRGRDGYYRGGGRHDRYGRRPHRPAIPTQCLRRVHGHNTLFVAPARCLQRHMRQAHRLPQVCKMRARFSHGIRSVYSVRCLRHRGFRIARH
ncbi:MAG: hypothetical protein QNJ09_17140 [Paracoccaceae bacterium]|nr:hypothetical protein [Paracoccaceae bacterium]